MDADTTSPTLLSRVRDPADTAAWREFDSRYGELVLRYCRRRGLQHSDAEDVRQMVMLKVSKALRDFKYDPQRGRFRGFLWRIVRNENLRYVTRPNTAPNRVDTHGSRTAEPVAPRDRDDVWEEEWTHHHLRLAMRRIRETFDPRSVSVFESLLSGEAVDAVAGQTGMTTDAVHKVKQRVRNRLKELIAEQISEEDQFDA